jgi:hypothetical protein
VSTVFADLVAVLFADENLSVPGSFTPQDTGIPIATRIHIVRNDPVLKITITSTSARLPAWQATIPTSDVPDRPVIDDVLTVDEGEFAGSYAVHDVHQDPLGLTWKLDLGVLG